MRGTLEAVRAFPSSASGVRIGEIQLSDALKIAYGDYTTSIFCSMQESAAHSPLDRSAAFRRLTKCVVIFLGHRRELLSRNRSRSGAGTITE